MIIERIEKDTGVIEKMFLSQALRKITEESHWSAYAAKDRLKEGLALNTPKAKYVPVEGT